MFKFQNFTANIHCIAWLGEWHDHLHYYLNQEAEAEIERLENLVLDD